MLFLLAVCAVGAALGRLCRDNPLPLRYAWSNHVAMEAQQEGMRTVDVSEAKAIVDSFSHIVLDARKTPEFHEGHIPGAMSLPVGEFDKHIASVSALLTPAQPIMVYCSGHECDESLELGGILIRSGFTNVTLFAGGMTSWKKAGYRVER